MWFGRDLYRGRHRSLWQLGEDLGKDGGDVLVRLDIEAKVAIAGLEAEYHDGGVVCWYGACFARRASAVDVESMMRWLEEVPSAEREGLLYNMCWSHVSTTSEGGGTREQKLVTVAGGDDYE